MKLEQAIQLEQTQFPNKVLDPSISKSPILKRSTNNTKFGNRKVWRAGSFKGMPLYSLTLEERATCPTDCKMFYPCYGGNMPFANRYQHGLKLEQKISEELSKLDEKHPEGYSIRLHVLGDFYSVEYVKFWELMLLIHGRLHIFGYTHRTGEIEREIDRVFKEFGARFNILQSDKSSNVRPSALTEVTAGHENLITCPQQTGQVGGCLDCGFCTLPNVKGVAFLIH